MGDAQHDRSRPQERVEQLVRAVVRECGVPDGVAQLAAEHELDTLYAAHVLDAQERKRGESGAIGIGGSGDVHWGGVSCSEHVSDVHDNEVPITATTTRDGGARFTNLVQWIVERVDVSTTHLWETHEDEVRDYARRALNVEVDNAAAVLYRFGVDGDGHAIVERVREERGGAAAWPPSPSLSGSFGTHMSDLDSECFDEFPELGPSLHDAGAARMRMRASQSSYETPKHPLTTPSAPGTFSTSRPSARFSVPHKNPFDPPQYPATHARSYPYSVPNMMLHAPLYDPRSEEARPMPPPPLRPMFEPLGPPAAPFRAVPRPITGEPWASRDQYNTGARFTLTPQHSMAARRSAHGTAGGMPRSVRAGTAPWAQPPEIGEEVQRRPRSGIETLYPRTPFPTNHTLASQVLPNGTTRGHSQAAGDGSAPQKTRGLATHDPEKPSASGLSPSSTANAAVRVAGASASSANGALADAAGASGGTKRTSSETAEAAKDRRKKESTKSSSRSGLRTRAAAVVKSFAPDPAEKFEEAADEYMESFDTDDIAALVGLDDGAARSKSKGTPRSAEGVTDFAGKLVAAQTTGAEALPSPALAGAAAVTLATAAGGAKAVVKAAKNRAQAKEDPVPEPRPERKQNTDNSAQKPSVERQWDPDREVEPRQRARRTSRERMESRDTARYGVPANQRPQPRREKRIEATDDRDMRASRTPATVRREPQRRSNAALERADAVNEATTPYATGRRQNSPAGPQNSSPETEPPLRLDAQTIRRVEGLLADDAIRRRLRDGSPKDWREKRTSSAPLPPVSVQSLLSRLVHDPGATFTVSEVSAMRMFIQRAKRKDDTLTRQRAKQKAMRDRQAYNSKEGRPHGSRQRPVATPSESQRAKVVPRSAPIGTRAA